MKTEQRNGRAGKGKNGSKQTMAMLEFQDFSLKMSQDKR